MNHVVEVSSGSHAGDLWRSTRNPFRIKGAELLFHKRPPSGLKASKENISPANELSSCGGNTADR